MLISIVLLVAILLLNAAQTAVLFRFSQQLAATAAATAAIHIELVKPHSEPPPIWQRLQRRGSDWVPDGWVREGSSAWQKAYDQPGLALRQSHQHDIVEGAQ